MRCFIPCSGCYTHHLCVNECMRVHRHTHKHTHTNNTCSQLHSLNHPLPPSFFLLKTISSSHTYNATHIKRHIFRRIDRRQAKPSTLYPYWSFYHIMPAFFADMFLWATGREPRWVQSLQTQQGVWCGALAILYQGVP